MPQSLVLLFNVLTSVFFYCCCYSLTPAITAHITISEIIFLSLFSSHFFSCKLLLCKSSHPCSSPHLVFVCAHTHSPSVPLQKLSRHLLARWNSAPRWFLKKGSWLQNPPPPPRFFMLQVVYLEDSLARYKIFGSHFLPLHILQKCCSIRFLHNILFLIFYLSYKLFEFFAKRPTFFKIYNVQYFLVLTNLRQYYKLLDVSVNM